MKCTGLRRTLAWTQPLGINTSKVCQEVRRACGTDPVVGAPKAIRCLIATQRLSRGDVVASIPRRSVLEATSSLNILQHFLGSDSISPMLDALKLDAATQSRCQCYYVPLLHRDALLQMAGLAILRLSLDASHEASFVNAESVQRSLWRSWVGALPRNSPPIGATLNFVATQSDVSERFPESPLIQDAEKEMKIADLATIQEVFSTIGRQFSRAVLRAMKKTETDAALAEVQEVFEWANFMFRSRSTAVGASARAPSMVPLVDMINHSLVEANVSLSHPATPSAAGAETSADVVVFATKGIEVGDEILLNYGHFVQRARFLPTKVRTVSSETQHKLSSSKEATNNELSKRLAGVSREDAQSRHGLVSDRLSWAWQFGFPLPAADAEHAYGLLWGNDLKRRVANMTLRMRSGAKTEFVPGVPPGLPHLTAARDALERERFGGRRIFPRQAE